MLLLTTLVNYRKYEVSESPVCFLAGPVNIIIIIIIITKFYNYNYLIVIIIVIIIIILDVPGAVLSLV